METIKLTVLFFRENEDTIIASCPALDISTCGNTFEEARHNSSEMLEVFFEEAERMGTLDRILTECGIKQSKKNAFPMFIACETEEVRIPCNL